MHIATEISAYTNVTALLDPVVQAILAGQYTDSQWLSHYNPERTCPDLERTLPEMAATPIDFAVNKNLLMLVPYLSAPAGDAMMKMLGGYWERSSVLWYPAANGFMDWHTNYGQPGLRVYLVWCAEGGKARFFSSPDGGKTIHSVYEPAGWSVRMFILGDKTRPFWHALTSGGTTRISIGFRPHGISPPKEQR